MNFTPVSSVHKNKNAEFHQVIGVLLTTALYRTLCNETIAELVGVEPYLVKWVEEEVIYIGQGYRYALRDQDAFCLVIQDSLQGKSELQG